MAQREPCPGRIFDDLGGAFAMGASGGAIFYFFKGFYNSPSRERFKGAIHAIKNRAPVLGGSFALWGGCFSTIDCSLLWYRQEESPIHAVIAGFLTGGFLALRAGLPIAWRNALAGGVILTIIEGVNIFYTNLMVRNQMMMMHQLQKLQEEKIRAGKGREITQEDLEMLHQQMSGGWNPFGAKS